MHFNRGGIFENFVLLEIKKYCQSRNIRPGISFWQNSQRKEIDVILEISGHTIALEIKAGKTHTPHYFDNLKYWKQLSGSDVSDLYVIYAGDLERKTSTGTLYPWFGISSLLGQYVG